ncbi:hypothetical protein DVJ77_11300 [Dyella tabacisoli]|uniref:Uncharacterized protein n=1 Tax=Dyella tabacisoli TaxID=2282381 RepID=A0A369ULV7_9GAMM|nr:hypothetical protein DVJ77_11300 [Dyella tabacisoli]
MRVLSLTAIVLALIAIQTLLTYSPGISAFEVPKLSLEEKDAKSTIVFIGTMKDADYQDLRRTRNEFVAQVRIDTTLKGTTPSIPRSHG